MAETYRRPPPHGRGGGEACCWVRHGHVTLRAGGALAFAIIIERV